MESRPADRAVEAEDSCQIRALALLGSISWTPLLKARATTSLSVCWRVLINGTTIGAILSLKLIFN